MLCVAGSTRSMKPKKLSKLLQKISKVEKSSSWHRSHSESLSSSDLLGHRMACLPTLLMARKEFYPFHWDFCSSLLELEFGQSCGVAEGVGPGGG